MSLYYTLNIASWTTNQTRSKICSPGTYLVAYTGTYVWADYWVGLFICGGDGSQGAVVKLGGNNVEGSYSGTTFTLKYVYTSGDGGLLNMWRLS